MSDANRLKDEGDKWFGQGQICNEEYKILRAELCYSNAIQLDPNNKELYARRSAARAKIGDHWRAVTDAQKAIYLNSGWSTGYACKGFALASLSRFLDAIEAYKEALTKEPRNVMLVKELTRVEEAYDNKYKDLIEKLKAKPHTREWLNDPEYLENVKKIAQGPWYLREYVNNGGNITDWRLVHADLIVSGFDKYITISGISERSEVVEDPLKAKKDKSTPPPKAIEPEKPNNEGIPQHPRLTSDENHLGFEAHMKRKYDSALKHFQKAIELYPTNIIFYYNIAAVYFEQKEYEKCIKECEKAVEIGRENRAEARLIAQVLIKIGNTYTKMGQWKLAKEYYEKSISEHESPETKKLLKEVESRIR